jgi:hypothetical protein
MARPQSNILPLSQKETDRCYLMLCLLRIDVEEVNRKAISKLNQVV